MRNRCGAKEVPGAKEFRQGQNATTRPRTDVAEELLNRKR